MRELKQNNEAVTVTWLTNKFPAFFETRIFITLCLKQVYNQRMAHIKNVKHSACFGWGTLMVAQLVEALRYKSEGRGFDSRWCHCNFSLTIALGLTQPLTEMSTRNISLG
jgi:hypothetical protein